MEDILIPEPCVKCGFDDLHEHSQYCPNCGTYLFNHCTNDMCVCNNGESIAFPNSFRYCDSCGCETTYLQDGLISEFEE